MPEGDTIFRAARTLNQALAGRTVIDFDTQLAQLAMADRDLRFRGQTVTGVEARGKHLLMHFSEGRTLRTHMRMNGSWHLYRHGERWKRSPHRARVVITTDAFIAVGFDLPVAEVLRTDKLERHEPLQRLGPDLLSEDFDPQEALRRMRAKGHKTLAEALLDQTLVAGAGNVFKSELLFLERLNPFLQVWQVEDGPLLRVLALAQKLLLANVRDGKGDGIVTYTGFRRTTGRANPAERLWVYGRVGQPCRVCGTPIALERRGVHARSTYYCPACQAGSADAAQDARPQ